MPAKLEEEIQWNKICVDLVGPCKILIKGRDLLIQKIRYNDRPHNGVV